MRRFHQLLSFFLFGTAVSLASPSTHSFNNRETIIAPRGWTRETEAPADHLISLRIGLHQRNFALLEKHLYEVSDPTHPRYGEHLSKGEVEDLVSPHPNSLRAVNAWLSEFNLKEDDITRSPAKDWVVLAIPVSLAEKMLNTVILFLQFISKDTEAEIVFLKTEILCLETRQNRQQIGPHDKL